MRHASNRNAPRTPPVRGMTLIELMVGLALGMIISVAALKLFGDASAGGKNIQRASIQIENGRFVSELLRDDLALSGYFGELAVDGATYTTPSPCETTPSGFAASPLTLPAPVQGFSAGQAIACANNRRAGTDAIVSRRLDIDVFDPSTLGGANKQFYLQNSFCDNDPVSTPLVMSDTAAAFTLRDRACAAVNSARPYLARLYYVADCNRCSGAGADTTPTLKRVELVGNQLVETALVEGLEQFRLEYGFDLDGNGSADVYRTGLDAAGPASRWENVMTVKLHFVVRSPEAALGDRLATAQTFQLGGTGTVTTANDGFVRRAYSTTVLLVNPSGAREQQ